MKRIIYISVFLIFSVSAKAQIVVPSIQKMVNLSSAAKNTTVVVTDPIRGGSFRFTRDEQVIDSGVVFMAESASLSGGYFVRMFEGSPKPQWYNINTDGTANDSTVLYNFLQYHKRNQICVEWGDGTFMLPIDFSFDFGDTTMCFIGNGSDKTTITQNSGVNSMQYPKPIDLTIGKPSEDGVYIIDRTAPTISSDYSELDSTTIDSYVRILNGTPSNVSLSTVKGLNYVTDVDAGGSAPSDNGLYVVSEVANAWTGSFTPDSLAWDGSVKVNLGSIIQKNGDTWSQYNNGNLFSFSGDLTVYGINFSNICSFIFNPETGSLNSDLSITNCNFERIFRVFSPQYSGGLISTDGVINHWLNYAPLNNGFSFNEFLINGCVFNQIHQSIAWYIPPSNRIIIENNTIINSPNTVLCFYALVTTRDRVTRQNDVVDISHNFIYNCKNSGSNAINKTIFRVGYNAEVYNNQVKFSDGIFFFFLRGGVNVYGNTVEPVSLYDNEAAAIFFFKGIGDGLSSTLSSNKILGGFNTGVYYNHESKITAIGNDFRLGNSLRYVTTKTTFLDDNISYEIRDTSTFFTLAGSGNYESGLVEGSIVYFNERKRIWESATNIPGGSLPQSTAFFSESNYKIEVDWNGNYTSCRYFQRADPSPIIEFDISNSEIISNSFAFTNTRDFAKTINIVNSKIETYNQSTIIGHQVRVDNSTLNSSHLGQFIIESDTNIYINNCKVGYVDDIHGVIPEFGNVRGVYEEKVVLRSGKWIYITNSHINNDDAGFRSFSIESGKRLYANNNFFDCYISTVNLSATKQVFEIATTASGDTLNLIDFSNNTVKFPTAGTGERSLFWFNSGRAYGIDTMVIDNILLANPFEQVDNIIDSINANITGVDYLRLGIEWEAANSLPAYVTETYRPNERNSSGVLYITTTSLNDTLAFYQLIPDVVTASSNRDLASSDVENRVRCTTSITLTIPLNFSAMAAEQTITVLKAFAGTSITITGATGVTVNGSSGGSATITGDYKAGIIYKVSTNTYEVY